ncbi:MAG: hypothetical protein V3T28_00950 [Gemmatimonadales bacterium]
MARGLLFAAAGGRRCENQLIPDEVVEALRVCLIARLTTVKSSGVEDTRDKMGVTIC